MNITKSGYTWEEFLERYLIDGEEFVFIYKDIKYHFSSHDDSNNNEIAELNFWTREKGYVNLEFPSRSALLRNARIKGKRIKDIWKDLV